MDFKIIYENNDVLVVDKPAGIVVFPEGKTIENTLIDALIEKYSGLKAVGEAPRYGIVHRLDKDTSGVLLVAKSAEALIFLQKQFKSRGVEKKYLCLVEGDIKENKGIIKNLIARAKGDPRKQKVYSELNAPKSAREAITEFKVVERYKDKKENVFTFLEVQIKTGRRHQIRCHFSYLKHPIVGDKLYGFKNSPEIEGLDRQFLHAQYLKIQLPACAGRPDGKTEEFKSELPEELHNILNNLHKI